LAAANSNELDILAICHYVVAALTALASCFALIWIGLGIAMATHPDQFAGDGGQPPPEFVPWMFLGIGAACLLFGWALAICVAMAGRFLKRHRHYLFCMIVSAVNCLFFPFGTVLGVFTIIVLLRPDVKALFAQTDASRA